MKDQGQKISATIITLNEERNISECLECLTWADEIVILDSESNDRTVDIAKQYTDKVFVEEWNGQGLHKNRAAELAQGPWILSIDADERVSPALGKEIRDAVNSNSPSAFRMRRKNFYKNQWIRHCGWWPDWVIRLYRKQDICFNTRKIHESLETVGPVGKLNEPLMHYSFNSVEEFLERGRMYSKYQADDMYKNDKYASSLTAISHGLFTFFSVYFLRAGFLDGSAGFLISSYNAIGVFSKYMMLAEKIKNNKS